MANVLHIEQCRPSSGDSFLFDANIWMYLFCPVGDHNRNVIAQYSRFFKEALIAKSRILVPALILSEFYNAYVRLELRIYRSQFQFETEFKKDFKKTRQYLELVPQIKTAIGKILRFSERIDDCFTRVDINHIFDGLEKCDFNDKYYIELSNLCNFTVVTDDADFALKEIPVRIVTANRKMLRST